MTYKPLKNMVPDAWWKYNNETFFADAYYRGDHSIEGWLEKEYLSVEQRTHREVSGVKKILDLRRSDSIIDVPCGWGKHSLCLASQGFNITGLDLNPFYLSLAQAIRKAYGFQNKPYFREGDMRQLPFRSKQFTVVLNLVLSFGFFDDADNEQTLREFCRVLKKGGKCLIHTDINPARVLNGSYEDRNRRTLTDGGKLIVSEEYDKNSKRILGSWTIVQPSGQEIRRFYSLRIYTNDEMEKMLQQAGFDLIGIFGSLDNAAISYSEECQEVVYVARKR